MSVIGSINQNVFKEKKKMCYSRISVVGKYISEALTFNCSGGDNMAAHKR